jgi:undecaprenyl-diphosphatase
MSGIKRRLGAVLLVAGALGVAGATAHGRGRRLDDRIYAFLNSRLEHPALDAVMRGVTELGSIYASAAASVAIAASGRRREALNAATAAGAMWMVGQSLKKRYGRPRPYLSEAPGRLLIGKPLGTSWPSVHPAVFTAFSSVAARDLDVAPAARSAVSAIASAVAFSRIYLGVHYPSDVAGGVLLGRAMAALWPAVRPSVR